MPGRLLGEVRSIDQIGVVTLSSLPSMLVWFRPGLQRKEMLIRAAGVVSTIVIDASVYVLA